MGRGGGGGGGHHSMGGGSMGHHSMGGGSMGNHSSFGGSRSGSFGGGPSGGFGGPRPNSHRPMGGPVIYTRPHYGRVYTRPVGGTGCGCLGCGAYFPVCLVILLIILIICSATGNTTVGGGYLIEDSVADDYAKQIYEEEFGNAADGTVLLITETENWKDEYETFACGSDAEPLIRQYKDEFWNLFDDNYQDDVARQITATLYEVVQSMSENGETAISDSDLDYRGQKFIEDNINAFDSEGTLADAMEDFYDSTGIRLYVIAEKYDSFAGDLGAKPESGTDFTTVFIVLIVATAVVLVVYLLFKWWKAKKKQKNIEDENTIKILNTPLETFGDTDLKQTAAKYDSNDDSTNS